VLVTTTERYASLKAELSTCDSVEVVVLVGTDEAPATDAAYRIRTWSELVADSDWPPQGPAEPAIDVDVAAILYTSGSTGLPKGVVLSHRNLRAGADSVSEYLGNTADDVILAALPLSFDAGLSQLTTGFTVGAHVVLHNYLLPGDVVTACRRWGVTASPECRPCGSRSPEQEWPARPPAHCDTSPNTGGRMSPAAALTRLREHFLRRQALPHVRADRGVPLDLPRSRRGRPASDSIGKADPQHRDPRGSSRTDPVASRAKSGELVPPRALSLPWATGTTRAGPRCGSGHRRRPAGGDGGASRVVRRLVRADEEGFLLLRRS
jgi:hypothetical protein